MRSIGLAFAVLLISGGMATTQAASAGPLDGVYTIAHRAYTPSSAKDPIASYIMNMSYLIKIKNNQVFLLNNDGSDPGNGSIATCVFDSQNSQNVDFQYNGGSLHAIYGLDGDVVTIALSFDSNRPTTLDDSNNNLLLVMTKG